MPIISHRRIKRSRKGSSEFHSNIVGRCTRCGKTYTAIPPSTDKQEERIYEGWCRDIKCTNLIQEELCQGDLYIFPLQHRPWKKLEYGNAKFKCIGCLVTGSVSIYSCLCNYHNTCRVCCKQDSSSTAAEPVDTLTEPVDKLREFQPRWVITNPFHIVGNYGTINDRTVASTVGIGDAVWPTHRR